MADTASQPKFSLGLGGGQKAKLSINGVKRPHSALASALDDEADESQATSVSHFDRKAGGAIDASRPKKDAPLVIPSQKNRDWKEASKRRRQQGPLPEQNQDASARIAAIEEAERKERDRSFGLNVMKTDEQSNQDETNDQQEDAVTAPAVVRTEDERAMDALLGRQQQSTLVVPAVSETEAFKDDFKSAPDMATLADYDRVPVEQFGAAMLRGMGWKDGDGVGLGAKKASKAKTESVIKRPALLGIGAKPDAAVDAELGGWGKAARGKEIKIYNPVLLKDKRTGELFTEDELQKKKEDAQRMAFEEEFEARERKREERKRRDRREDDREHRHSSDRHRHRDDDRRRRHEDDRERGHRSRHDRNDEDRSHRSRRDKEDDDRSHRSYRDDGRSRKDRDYKHERRYRDDSRERRHDRSSERRHLPSHTTDRVVTPG